MYNTSEESGGYPDEGGFMGFLGEVPAASPTPGFPTSGDARQQAVNNPAQVRIDAANFRLLDLPAPDTGNAYDPAFRAVVTEFQAYEGLTADGLIGPTTRSRLVSRVSALQNAAPPGPSPLPLPPVPDPIFPPDIVIPVPPPSPNVLPGPAPAPRPVVAAEKDNTKLYLGIGVGVLVLGGLAAWALSD